jgi:predicted RNase H-like nuclease (RuvC/YqgF family)
MDQQTNQEVEPQVSSPNSDADQATVLLSLEEMIKNTAESIERLTAESRELSSMIADGFQQDAAYNEIDQQVKELTKKRSEQKKVLMNQQGIRDMSLKVKDARATIKDKKQALSDYLLEYKRLVGDVNEIQANDGAIMEIIQSARLVKRLSSKGE